MIFYRLKAGYRFNRSFAAEISRSDFGDIATIDGTAWETGPDGTRAGWRHFPADDGYEAFFKPENRTCCLALT